MRVDSRTLDDAAEVNAEVCIVGAGPAGISLALQLIAKPFSVCLIESGDINANAETAALADGENVGDPISPLRDMRHRQFGGQSNVWNIVLDKETGVRHVDLSGIDFEKRDWVPYSGWPITKTDLIPYYEKAHHVSGLKDYNYSIEPWESKHTPSVKFSSGHITSSVFKFGPSKIFNQTYREQIDRSSNITTYTNATVVEIELAENAKSVKRLHATCLNGKKFTARGKHFILASGGTENPRLMLLSDKVQKGGVGNQNDVVGRYFIDHPLVYAGLLFPYDKKVFSKMALYDKRLVNNEMIMGKFELSQAVLRREKMLNIGVMFFPRDKSYQSEVKASAKVLRTAFTQGHIPADALTHLRNVSFHGHELINSWYKYRIRKEVVKPNLAYGNWSSEKDVEKKYVKFEVVAQTEQAPDPDNRVVLSDRLDKIGFRQAKLINFWKAIDKESVKKAEAIFAKEFAAAGLGELKIEPLERQRVMLSTHHNMGTTRMSEDPKHGVVNSQCKVHGVSNLYVAGSSVFPTGGFANPTLTIIALAVRLADHIIEKINEPE